MAVVGSRSFLEAMDRDSAPAEAVLGTGSGAMRGLCWMRVFSRSAGCKRTAERRPEQSPAAK